MRDAIRYTRGLAAALLELLRLIQQLSHPGPRLVIRES